MVRSVGNSGELGLINNGVWGKSGGKNLDFVKTVEEQRAGGIVDRGKVKRTEISEYRLLQRIGMTGYR